MSPLARRAVPARCRRRSCRLEAGMRRREELLRRVGVHTHAFQTLWDSKVNLVVKMTGVPNERKILQLLHADRSLMLK